jgi:hypothetical protein
MFQVGAAEIALDIFVERSSLLFSNDHDRFAIECCKSTKNGETITKQSIAREFRKGWKKIFDMISEIRSVGMPCN